MNGLPGGYCMASTNCLRYSVTGKAGHKTA